MTGAGLLGLVSWSWLNITHSTALCSSQFLLLAPEGRIFEKPVCIGFPKVEFSSQPSGSASVPPGNSGSAIGTFSRHRSFPKDMGV